MINPILHAQTINPPKKLSREDKGLARRMAKFTASRNEETTMATPTMQMHDMNPGVPPQTKLKITPLPPRPTAAAVQRVQRLPDAPVPDLSEALVAELETDFGESPAPEAMPEPADVDVEAILQRFKGTPEQIARQVAKSYKESEKRMRQLEGEKQLLMKAPPAAAPQPTLPQTLPQQLAIAPTFDYKKWGDSFLDKPEERAKELEAHIGTTLEQKLVQFAAPLYEEALENRLFRKFGDIVTEENLDIIKAMAHNEPGTDRWQKTLAAVTKYKAAMPNPNMIMKSNADVAAMADSVETPSPQARATGDRKMWKASDLRKIMQRHDYHIEPKYRKLIDKAYAEGRVLRDE